MSYMKDDLLLDPLKFRNLLHQRKITVSGLAKQCGISRQSIYQLIKGQSAFNVPFRKLMGHLRVNPLSLLKHVDTASDILETAPLKIRKIGHVLIEYCKSRDATLVLFGSKARGHFSSGSDWDLGIWFHRKSDDRSFRDLKNKILDEAFPHRVDLLNLSRAPEWFLKSIADDYLVVFGNDPAPLLHFKEAA